MKRTPISEEQERLAARRRALAQRIADENACDPDLICATCQVELVPEHAHYKCPSCGQRDSCCF